MLILMVRILWSLLSRHFTIYLHLMVEIVALVAGTFVRLLIILSNHFKVK